MFTLSSVAMQGFRLFREHTFVSFKCGAPTYVIGRNNDAPGANNNMSGKSTFVSAITWCLYGCDSTGVMLYDDAISSAKEEASVWCTLMVPARVGHLVYIINRVRSKKASNTLSITTSKNEKWEGRWEEVQQRIDALLGHRSLFLAAHVFAVGEKSTPFALLPDRSQKQLFDLLIESDDLIVAEAKAKKAYDRAVYDAAQLEVRRVTLLATLRELKMQKAASQHTQKELARLSAELVRAKVDLIRSDSLPLKLANESFVVSAQSAAALEQIVKKRLRAMQHLKSEYTRTERRLASTNGMLSEVREQAVLSCPECGADINGAYQKLRIESLSVVVNRHESTMRGLKVKARNVRAKIKRDKAKLKAAQEQADWFRSETLRLSKMIDEARNKHAHAKRSLDAFKSGAGTVYSDLQRRISELKRDKALVASAFVSTSKDRDMAQFWRTAFGPSGIRVHRLNMITPLLNEVAKRYASALFGDGKTVQYSTLKENKGGDTREAFSVTVRDKDGALCRTLSAGEAQRRDVIHTFSIMAIAEVLKKRSVNFIALDEVFRSLDSSGIDAVMKILVESTGPECVTLVIEHDEEFASYFSQSLIVTRTDGCSDIELV